MGANNANKRTLAFQVDEEFYLAVQECIKTNNMKLKDFGITAMQRLMAELTAANSTSPANGEEPDQPEQEPA